MVHIGWIIPTLLTALIYGMAAGRGVHDRAAATVILLVGGVQCWAMLELGYYWQLFPRGHGFFTANRLSAAAATAMMILAPVALALWRQRRAP